jgi:hypothetical protein
MNVMEEGVCNFQLVFLALFEQAISEKKARCGMGHTSTQCEKNN